jgi:hypothetical protein
MHFFWTEISLRKHNYPHFGEIKRYRNEFVLLAYSKSKAVVKAIKGKIV